MLVSYCVTERITVPGQPAARRHDRRGVSVRPLGRRRGARRRRGAARRGRARAPPRALLLPGGASAPRGCFLFETAARLGGGFDADVTRLASGVDLYDRLLGVALGDAGLERQGVVGPARRAAIAKFLVARPGIVRAVRGPRRGPRHPRRRRRAGVRRCRRPSLAADRQREARRLRPCPRRRREARPTARADEALARVFHRHRRRVVRRGDRVTHAHAHERDGLVRRLAALSRAARARRDVRRRVVLGRARLRPARHGALALALQLVQRPVGRAPARARRARPRRRRPAGGSPTWAAGPGGSRAGSPRSDAPAMSRVRLLAGHRRGGAPRVERARLVGPGALRARRRARGARRDRRGLVRRRDRPRLPVGRLPRSRLARARDGQRSRGSFAAAGGC